MACLVSLSYHKGVRIRALQSFLAVLFCSAHVTTVIAGPAGLLLCQDSDGRSHFEWLIERCCAIADDRTREKPAPEISIDEFDASTCADGLCIDEPVSLLKAIGDAPNLRPDRDISTALSSSVGLLDSVYVIPARQRLLATGKTPCGPPVQIIAALRSTILII